MLDVVFFLRPTGRLPHMQRIAMDVIGEGSLNRRSECPSLEHYPTFHDFVFKQHQMYNMDMAAEKLSFLTEVAEALSRCSCTRSPIYHSGSTRSVHFNWADAKWIYFTRRLLGVKPPARRSGMHIQGKVRQILCDV